MRFLPYTLLALSLGGFASAAPAATPTPTCTPTPAPPPCADMTPSRTLPTVIIETAKLQARQSQPANQGNSIPPYVPIVTAAATQDAALASLGYYQTTYYECRTRDGTEHCGWHIPVQKIKSAGEKRRPVGWAALAVAAGVAGWIVL